MKRWTISICLLLAVCMLAACVATADPTGTSGTILQSAPSTTRTTVSTQQTTVSTASSASSTAPTVTEPVVTTEPATIPTTIPTTVPTTEPTAAPTTAPPAPTQPPVPVEDRIVYMHDKDYTYTDMEEDLQLLVQAYPQWLSCSVYGTSLDNRNLYAATLGSPDAPKQVIITAGMHASEYINPYLVMLQLEYYLYYYETVTYGGQLLKDLFSEVAFVVAPMTNPDGNSMVQEGLESIRSQELRDTVTDIFNQYERPITDINAWIARYWKSNAAGVDLNRNYDIFTWEDYNEYDGNIQEPGYQYYKGPSANSEPETYYLIQLTESLSNPVASICVHSRGRIIYWKCYQEGDFAQENLELAYLAQDITGYGIIHENQYEPSYSNWTILAHQIPTLTVETCYYAPHPMDIAEHIAGAYDENRDLWAAIALAYLDT